MSVDFESYCYYGFCLSYNEFKEACYSYDEEYDEFFDWYDEGDRYTWCQYDGVECLDEQLFYIGVSVGNGETLKKIESKYYTWLANTGLVEFDFEYPALKEEPCLHCFTYISY